VKSQVKSYMTGKPISIEPSASALAALDLMVDYGIRHLPVVDRAGHVCGVVSFDDLRAALPMPISRRVPPAVEERDTSFDLALGEVMTYSPVTIRYDAPLEEAAQLMVDGRIGCLPVVDEKGQLDGIVTETDLLQAVITALWAAQRSEPAPPQIGLATALERERSHLLRQLAAHGRQAREPGETRREPSQGRPEDEEGWFTEHLAELASRRLRAIEHALEREKRGELGTCEGCNDRIPEGRLRALPGTTLCIRCARAAEVGR